MNSDTGEIKDRKDIPKEEEKSGKWIPISPKEKETLELIDPKKRMKLLEALRLKEIKDKKNRRAKNKAARKSRRKSRKINRK